MTNEEFNGARFEVVGNTSVYNDEGVLIKKDWLDYMQSSDYAGQRMKLYYALDDVERYLKSEMKADFSVEGRIDDAREANEELIKHLPFFDNEPSISDLERQVEESD